MLAEAPVNALRHNRNVLEAYLDLGLMYLERKQPEAALDTLDKVLQANPQEPEALEARARALALLGSV